MNILLFSLANLSTSTADAITTLRTAKSLADCGHTVTLVAPSQASNDFPIDAGNATVSFHWNVVDFGLPNTFNTLVQVFQVSKLCRRAQADTLYVRAATFTFLFGLWGRLSGRAKVVGEHHGWFEAERRSGGQHRWFAPIEGYFQVLDARMADCVRTVVPGIRERLVNLGVNPARVFVVGNACDTELIRPLPRDVALRRFDLPEQNLYLGFVGSLTIWQGLDEIVEGVGEVVKSHPEARLLIIGDGPQRAQLEALVERKSLGGNIRFFGRMDHSDIAAVMSCFDIALIPTADGEYRSIGRSPLKLREYAAAGRVVLAARIPAIEDLESEAWMHLFDAENPSNFVSAIDALAARRDTFSDLGQCARRFAEDNYAWPIIIRKIVHQIESATGAT
mgnify:CR=1 FL=1